MIILKYFGSHMSDLGNYFWENIGHSVGNIRFVTNDGSVLCHKLLIIYHFPALKNMLCNECDTKNEDTTIIVPDLGIEVIKVALENLYKVGSSDQLRTIFINIFSERDENLENTLDIEAFMETTFKENSDDSRKETETKSFYESNPINSCEIVLMNETKVTQCNKCDKYFRPDQDLEKHTCENINDQYQLSLPENVEFDKHFETIHLMNTDVIFKCVKCEDQFSEVSQTVGHFKNHENITIEHDQKKETKTLEHVKKPEIKDKRKVRQIKRIKMKRRFLESDFNSRSLTSGKTAYICNKCGKGCTNMSGAARHASVCLVILERRKRSLIFPCDLCAKIFKRENWLKLHKKTHREKISNMWDELALETSEASDNVETSIIERRKRALIFTCDLCGNIFKRENSLKLHKNTHREKTLNMGDELVLERGNNVETSVERKPTLSFPCNVCGKVFKREKWQKHHIKKHTKETLVKDEQEWKNNLDMGELKTSSDDEIITGESDSRVPKGEFVEKCLDNGKVVFQCKKCFKSCTNISGSTRHSGFCKKQEYRAGSSNPVPCELCTKVCLTIVGLTKHMFQVHSI